MVCFPELISNAFLKLALVVFRTDEQIYSIYQKDATFYRSTLTSFIGVSFFRLQKCFFHLKGKKRIKGKSWVDRLHEQQEKAKGKKGIAEEDPRKNDSKKSGIGLT